MNNNFSNVNIDAMNNLKLNYPSLYDIELVNNNLIYNGESINIDNIDLNCFKSYNQNISPIHFMEMMKDLAIIKQKELHLDDWIKQLKYFFILPDIDDKVMNAYLEYVKIYYAAFQLKNNYEPLNETFNKLYEVIEYAFNENYVTRTASLYLQNALVDYHSDLEEGRSNSYQLVRKNDNANIPEVVENDNKQYLKMTGFAKSSLIISITTILGIVLAILALYLGLK